MALVIVALLAIQPDFGQAALVLFSWGVMYFVAGAPMLLLLGLAGAAVAAGAFAYDQSEHFARRIDGFLTPDVDPRNPTRSMPPTRIREGAFSAPAWARTVKWSLPDAHTDFIIAVAAEEYGLVLVLVIIALYTTIVVRSLTRLMRERDPFIRLAGTGLAVVVGVQADDQHGRGGPALAREGHDAALRQLRRVVGQRLGDRRGDASGVHAHPAQGEIGDILLRRGRQG